jgi:hypothetical protein
MNKQETQTKETDVKFIKKVSPDKSKLPSRRDGGKKTEVIKTIGPSCVPSEGF